MMIQKFAHKQTTQHKVFDSGDIEAQINAFCLELANDTVNSFQVTQIVYLNASFAYVVYASLITNTTFDPTESFS